MKVVSKLLYILVLLFLSHYCFSQNENEDSSSPAIGVIYVGADTTQTSTEQTVSSSDTTYTSNTSDVAQPDSLISSESDNLEAEDSLKNAESPAVNIITIEVPETQTTEEIENSQELQQEQVQETIDPQIETKQEEQVPYTPENAYEYTSDDNVKEELDNTSLNRPVIGFGYGLFTYFGDVNDSYRKNPVVGRIGKSLTLTRNANDFLEMRFTATHGHITGNERTKDRNLNFQTEILVGGIGVAYNFKHIRKEKKWSILPYVSLGLEYFDFNSKGDLYDAYGNYYHYWSDGSVRNIAEDAPNASNSVVLTRDYYYETDLRELNLDGMGAYQQVAVGIPIDIGFDLPINEYASMRFGNAFHFTFSDLIDNVSKHGEGDRKGNNGKDKFMFTYFSLRINLFGGGADDVDDRFKDVDFSSINGDEDADGVLDFDDMCAATPIGVLVDKNGCPHDDDGDGIPNYNDQQANTSLLSYYIDEKGIGYTQEEYESRMVSGDTIAIHADEVEFYYPTQTKSFSSVYIELPKKFRIFDIDKDMYISPEELTKAIDMFFDFESSLTIDDIYELNEFFFTQDSSELDDW
jgi:hypothetical protein